MKVAMLTSGGDCQGLNSALRGVGKSLYKIFGKDVDIYGIRDGYRGLIYGDIRKMDPSNFSGILTLGGTILGTSRQPFKTMCLPMPEFGGKTKLDMMLENYRKYKFDCLVILGGNGTHKTANLLAQHGVNVVSLPKTIDNDLWGTDMTFGFQSAVDIATYVIDCIHTTATSHGRVFIVEVMGHKVGWLTLVCRHRGRCGRHPDSGASLRCGQGLQGAEKAQDAGQAFLHPGGGGGRHLQGGVQSLQEGI